ncbi:MAG: 3-oxoacyl-ACP synthase III family protein [Cyclobacteriaceae bacterium]|nr:3-oxoacyl-ACP synthase III family protein [Cyclobacteriaceae bacterium]MCH8516776.1 3-oxoacyl-ACP synthase III family protein [Cyclobacteriaceae bacterium]
MKNSIIIGSGAYIPEKRMKNADFENAEFYLPDSFEKINQPSDLIVRKFKAITGIEERRYADPDQGASEMGTLAAQDAINDANIDPDTIDHIIFAHSFGDISSKSIQSDLFPNLAARVKHHLRIKNPACVATDILFGCPGWVQAAIHADSFIKSGLAKRVLVIGSDTLAKVVDPYDRDSMIFADGGAAVIMEAAETQSGVITHAAVTHAIEELDYLGIGPSHNKSIDQRVQYIKMKGRKIYEYALIEVPKAMKACLEKGGVHLSKISKILIHQANEKMDEAIIKRLYELYDMKVDPQEVMPMNINLLGNSSVATVPTLYHQLVKGELEGHEIKSGEYILLASVGAGMHINAILYQMP